MKTIKQIRTILLSTCRFFKTKLHWFNICTKLTKLEERPFPLVSTGCTEQVVPGQISNYQQGTGCGTERDLPIFTFLLINFDFSSQDSSERTELYIFLILSVSRSIIICSSCHNRFFSLQLFVFSFHSAPKHIYLVLVMQ